MPLRQPNDRTFRVVADMPEALYVTVKPLLAHGGGNVISAEVQPPPDLWHQPIPGPLYWDWRCTVCSEPVSDHPSWWQRWRRRRGSTWHSRWWRNAMKRAGLCGDEEY